MPDARLQRCRESYECGREFVLEGWPHCPCYMCQFALRMKRLIQAGVPASEAFGPDLSTLAHGDLPLGYQFGDAGRPTLKEDIEAAYRSASILSFLNLPPHAAPRQ